MGLGHKTAKLNYRQYGSHRDHKVEILSVFSVQKANSVAISSGIELIVLWWHLADEQVCPRPNDVTCTMTGLTADQ